MTWSIVDRSLRKYLSMLISLHYNNQQGRLIDWLIIGLPNVILSTA